MSSAAELSLCFRRAWGDPECRGAIKREAGDFRVVEQLGFEPSGDGEHAYLNIRKTNTNTGWVVERLASAADVRPFDVGYAGRKDRRAITEQWFSCYLPGRMDPDWGALGAGLADDANGLEQAIEIISVTRHRKKLRRGGHQGNLFKIRIQALQGNRDRLELRLAQVKVSGFPNYFGEQRFGHGVRNLDCAQALFSDESGARRIAGRKKDIYVSAARAYLFNRVLSDRIANGSWRMYGDDGAVTTGPLYGINRGTGANLPAEPVPAGFEGWYEGLKRLKVKASRRPLCVIPEDFEWRFEDHDALSLSFGLPPGTYATSLLRELVHYEDALSED